MQTLMVMDWTPEVPLLHTLPSSATSSRKLRIPCLPPLGPFPDTGFYVAVAFIDTVGSTAQLHLQQNCPSPHPPRLPPLSAPGACSYFLLFPQTLELQRFLLFSCMPPWRGAQKLCSWKSSRRGSVCGRAGGPGGGRGAAGTSSWC